MIVLYSIVALFAATLIASVFFAGAYLFFRELRRAYKNTPLGKPFTQINLEDAKTIGIGLFRFVTGAAFLVVVVFSIWFGWVISGVIANGVFQIPFARMTFTDIGRALLAIVAIVGIPIFLIGSAMSLMAQILPKKLLDSLTGE